MTKQKFTLDIIRMSSSGSGVAVVDGKEIFVARTLPDEVVEVDLCIPVKKHSEGELVKVLESSPFRSNPVCEHFNACGGCSLQHVKPDFYEGWKKSQVFKGLAGAGVNYSADIGFTKTSENSRRRMRFLAINEDNEVKIGLRSWRSHDVVEIPNCKLPLPNIMHAIDVIKPVLKAIFKQGQYAEISIQAYKDLLDITIEGNIKLKPIHKALLDEFVTGFADGVRLCWYKSGELIGEWGQDDFYVEISGKRVNLSPRAFLQASEESQEALIEGVVSNIKNGSKVADLFCGAGTFTLPLLDRNCEVLGVELNQDSLNSLRESVGPNSKLKLAEKDLFTAPLKAYEINDYDAVVVDPPRAGANNQIKQIALSDVPLVIYISCGLPAFINDAKCLQDNGYSLEKISIVDQFLWSGHVETVAVFSK